MRTLWPFTIVLGYSHLLSRLFSSTRGVLAHIFHQVPGLLASPKISISVLDRLVPGFFYSRKFRGKQWKCALSLTYAEWWPSVIIPSAEPARSRRPRLIVEHSMVYDLFRHQLLIVTQYWLCGRYWKSFRFFESTKHSCWVFMNTSRTTGVIEFTFQEMQDTPISLR